MKLCGFEVGLDRPLFLIAGPCVVESRQLVLDTAGRLKEICAGLGVPFIFKASYDKANRSSSRSYRGPGRDEGLEILAEIAILAILVIVAVPVTIVIVRQARRHRPAPGSGTDSTTSS